MDLVNSREIDAVVETSWASRGVPAPTRITVGGSSFALLLSA
jgi:hypothetical protein